MLNPTDSSRPAYANLLLHMQQKIGIALLAASGPWSGHETQDGGIPQLPALVRRPARASNLSQPHRFLRKLGLSQGLHATGRRLGETTTAGARRPFTG